MTAYEHFLNKQQKNIRKCFPFLVVAGDITQGLVHACQVFQLPLRCTLEPEMETICIHWWEEARRYAQNKLDILDHFMDRWVKLATTPSNCIPYWRYMKIQTTSLGRPSSLHRQIKCTWYMVILPLSPLHSAHPLIWPIRAKDPTTYAWLWAVNSERQYLPQTISVKRHIAIVLSWLYIFGF